jgi:hypothetical protein
MDTIAYRKFCDSKTYEECMSCPCYLLYEEGILVENMKMTGGTVLLLRHETLVDMKHL